MNKKPNPPWCHCEYHEHLYENEKPNYWNNDLSEPICVGHLNRDKCNFRKKLKECELFD